MGNQSSASLNDDETIGKISNFDHNYKVYLKTIVGTYFQILGYRKDDHIEGQLICKATCMEIKIESLIITERKVCVIMYNEITEIGWDHSLCEVKFNLNPPNDTKPEFVILHVPMSIELEYEIKQRLQTLFADSSTPIPPFIYMGMFAGGTKPKPFQRKRPNISKITEGKLPVLATMRDIAVKRHQGSYAPCPEGTSRRFNLALEHIFEGFNTFPILLIHNDYGDYKNSFTNNSILAIAENKLIFYPNGLTDENDIDIPFDWISFWILDAEEVPHCTKGGIKIYFTSESSFGAGELHLEFPYIRDIKHSFEFFWNRYQIGKDLSVMMGSTHGRPLETIHTLGGISPAPPPPVGQLDIVDADGLVVRPGAKVKPGARASLTRAGSRRDSFRRMSSLNSVSFSSEAVQLPPETKVKHHWNSIVKHQGWLLKKGGVGVKHWIKRYFILYSTSQGHFLAYYSDILECPMYTTDKLHRNVIDLAKVTFIRPGSNNKGEEEIPPHSFDIQTIEREWTLCAESQDNVLKWLQLITRAVDEDVAIIPDEHESFSVKAKKDPTGQCVTTDYSTYIKFSAYAVSLFVPDTVGGSSTRLVCQWIYTDFYKWSIVTQNGKLALQLSVFIDETFSQKIEFLFRTTEAVLLGSMLEYFIEKFMTTMHIQLELDDTFAHHESESEEPINRKLPHASLDQWQTDQVTSLRTLPSQGEEDYEEDHNTEPDLLGFGSDDLGLAASSESLSYFAPSAPEFTGMFTATPPPVSLTPSLIPLTSTQNESHKKWYLQLLSTQQGPWYDDGTLQVACTVEIRGSQGRITFIYHNISLTETLFSLLVTMPDTGGFLRTQISPLKSHLVPQEHIQQTIMIECLQPSGIRPTIVIAYRSPQGSRKNTLLIPVTILSFNNPLMLAFHDFQLRWEMLTHPGQEIIEIFQSQQVITSDIMKHFISKVCKFHLIENTQDTSFYGAASLRTGSINPQTGEPITLGCLIKMDLDTTTNSIRIICRTVLPLATTALCQILKSILS